VTIRQLSLFLAATLLGSTVASGNDAVNESSRLLPVAYQVDVVVVVGSTGAVAAAVEAALSGEGAFAEAVRSLQADFFRNAAVILTQREGAKPLALPCCRRLR
jgi:hypothetical protein